jgi:N-acetylmuramoyl-L-alanine amidase
MKKTRFAIILLLALLTALPLNAQKRKGQTGKEPLFGKELATYTVASESLRGASVYLVAGHGGPDPGAIGIYQGRPLHEDEYAYDIVLRLGRELLMRGAQVHFIVQDKKDGIRNGAILKNSKRETCMGQAIPLDQVARLKQRSNKIDQLYKKDKAAYKRAIFVHVDSRSQGKQTDVYFYHAPGSKQGKRLADRMRSTLVARYKRHQPGRGFNGTVSARNLYVLRHTQPAGVYLELGNIRNPRDQQRLVLENNRQALAKWIAEAIVADYKTKK